MSIVTESFFQLSFPSPTDNNIQEYVGLKKFDSGSGIWSYFEDTFEFKKDTSSLLQDRNNKQSHFNVHYLSLSEIQSYETRRLFCKPFAEKVKEFRRKEAQVIYLEFSHSRPKRTSRAF